MKIDQSLIELCDREIRAGRPEQVARALAKLNKLKVAREWRLPLAKICRRAGLTSLGLSLLSPLVHSPVKVEITPAELAEYSVLLMRYGALSEALDKLRSVDAREVPEALLYQAYGMFLDWDFERTVPLLRNYLELSLEPYALLVGQANLVFALTECRQHDQARALTEKMFGPLKAGGHKQLQGTCHAMRAQGFIQDRDFKNARREIEAGQSLYPLSQTNDHFLLKKWGLILEALEAQSLEPLNKMRELARSAHDWEACREADMFSLLIERSEERFVHLFFGSPAQGFRERMMVELGEVPARDMYVLGPKSAPRLDLRNGQVDGKEVLNPGKKTHQLFQILLSDFYRPMRIAGLFSKLFPSEQFNIDSSPGRVHQVLRRARAWIKETAIPVNLSESNEYYSLELKGAISFRVPLNMSLADSSENQIEKLKSVCGPDVALTLKQIREHLGVSESTATRLIKWGVESGRLKKTEGPKRQTSYKIAA